MDFVRTFIFLLFSTLFHLPPLRLQYTVSENTGIEPKTELRLCVIGSQKNVLTTRRDLIKQFNWFNWLREKIYKIGQRAQYSEIYKPFGKPTPLSKQSMYV